MSHYERICRAGQMCSSGQKCRVGQVRWDTGKCVEQDQCVWRGKSVGSRQVGRVWEGGGCSRAYFPRLEYDKKSSQYLSGASVQNIQCHCTRIPTQPTTTHNPQLRVAYTAHCHKFNTDPDLNFTGFHLPVNLNGPREI